MALRKIAVWAALTVFLVFISTVEAAGGGVTFWGEQFTMTCPEEGTWYIKNRTQPPAVIDAEQTLKTYTLDYGNNMKGPHYCGYEGKKYYFYVQGKVCKDCFELDPTVFALAITLDMIVTAVLMMIIYKFGKRRSSGGPSNAPGGHARPGPSDQSSAYESLNVHTRNQDTYSKLNRMG